MADFRKVTVGKTELVINMNFVIVMQSDGADGAILTLAENKAPITVSESIAELLGEEMAQM